jgi:hypothetical protein
LGSPISKVDSVGIPSQDTERSRLVYVEMVGLQPDEQTPVSTVSPATFADPDGNELVLHKRYAPYSDGTLP